jgi:hypothetical protein
MEWVVNSLGVVRDEGPAYYVCNTSDDNTVAVAGSVTALVISLARRLFRGGRSKDGNEGVHCKRCERVECEQKGGIDTKACSVGYGFSAHLLYILRNIQDHREHN